ncbi:MAG: nickel pincer cofactor biosynthesis protein LarC [Candidatus Methanomethylicaceae archaeon]|nr:nickel pincer cofactor biosynthesis protein LarC [Candidatus Verstraetearchaeota archaeon]
MRIVILDPAIAGASGDKILSALVDLGGEKLKLELERKIENILGNKSFYFIKSESHGFSGVKVVNNLANLKCNNLLRTLENFSKEFQLGEWGRNFVNEVLSLILNSEREVHEREELHELSNLDFVLELVCIAKAIEILGIDGAQFFTTPIKVGIGWTICEHGTIPLPAPVTLNILKNSNLPIILSNEKEEFTTPTGAAIIAVLTKGKTSLPIFSINSIGVGIGERDFGIPNIMRILLSNEIVNEIINVIECNIDDISGEILGWFEEKLRGKVEDICFLPALMKKGRPGHVVRVVVKPEYQKEVVTTIMKELGSWGVKIFTCNRVRVNKEIFEEIVKIKNNDYKVRVKMNKDIKRIKLEYEDVKEIAKKEGISLREVIDEIMKKINQKYSFEL